MGEDGKVRAERELTIGEIAEEAMDAFDFGPEVMTLAEPDGYFCEMEPADFELARASIAYLAYQLLLMYRIKHGNVRGNPGGWVGVRHHETEIWKEIASALGIRGSEADRIGEVKRLYKVASRREDGDEDYRKKVWSVMEGLMEDHDLDASNLGIVFI